jgi:hypothetical protein
MCGWDGAARPWRPMLWHLLVQPRSRFWLSYLVNVLHLLRKYSLRVSTFVAIAPGSMYMIPRSSSTLIL